MPVAIILLCLPTFGRAVTVTQQSPSTLWLEAENYDSITNYWGLTTTTSGIWLSPTQTNAFQLPGSTTASASAALVNFARASAGSGVVSYNLAFTQSGIYDLHVGYSMFETFRNSSTPTGDPDDYKNEDSFFTATSFNTPISDFSSSSNDRMNLARSGHDGTNPNDGSAFYWQQKTGTNFVVPAGASSATPYLATFQFANREGGVAIDAFLFETIVVPEPSRAILLLLGTMGLLAARQRSL